MPFKRIITAAVGIPIVVGVIFAGQLVFTAVAVAAVIVMSIEYGRLLRAAGSPALDMPLYFFAAGTPAAGYYAGLSGILVWLAAMSVVLSAIAALGWGRIGFERLGGTAFGVIYLGAATAVLARTYALPSGTELLVFIFAATWIADTSAYTVGRLLGKMPLAPRISPKKTWEGTIGSIAVAAAAFAPLVFMPHLSSNERIVFAVALAVAAALGDLFESAIKRWAGVKDSGTLLPGHGGLLDRVDSLLLTGPLGYVLLRIWTG